MLTTYLIIGLVFAVASMFMTHNESFDKFSEEQPEGAQKQWKKILFSVSLVAFWPIFLYFVITDTHPE
jgi:hypothetical protein